MKKRTIRAALITCLASSVLWISCTKDKNNKDGEKPKQETPSHDFEITANLEFSKGKSVVLNANSVIPSMATPLVSEDGGATWMWTSGYEMEHDGLYYRIDFKAKIKDEAASYELYANDDDYLETLGWYLELTVDSRDGTVDELYQSRFEGNESGTLTINTISQNRLTGTFNADIPMSPVNGERLRISNGKIDISLMRITE